MNVLMGYILVFRKASPYSLYVLLILLLTYLINQLDRYALPIVSKDMAQEIHFGDKSCMPRKNVSGTHVKDCANLNITSCEAVHFNNTNISECEYNYNGKGSAYQAVAGPVFILIFTTMGIIISFFADKFQNKRVMILSCCLIWWSTMTLLSGLIKEYWQLVILRFGLGFGEAGCNPLATSLITDYFVDELRGSALGIYNWGIYTGYSMSIAIGNPILKAKGWRWVYYASGIPGLVVGIILFTTVRQPKKPKEDERPIVEDVDPSIEEDNDKSTVTLSFNGKLGMKMESQKTINAPSFPSFTEKFESALQNVKQILKEFFKPTLFLLCLASSIRNGAGYIWGYNYNFFYGDLNQTPEQITYWLSWIPIVGGLTGSFVGGFISDRLVKKSEPWLRIWVLVISQLAAVPFLCGVLLLNPPYSYICLIPGYIFGEMWVGVVLTIIVELVPEKLRNTGVSFYFFLITNIGGNMQNLLPPIQKLIRERYNLNEIESFRAVLFIFYPGEYVISSLVFLLTLFVLKRDLKRIQNQNVNQINSVANILYQEENNSRKATENDIDNEAININNDNK